MMASIRASQLGAQVKLLEKNSILGKKLLLSGKGRCNLTNACSLELFIQRFSKNGQFLRDAFKKFFNSDLINFFEGNGLKVKIERQLRVFPVTDKSVSIVSVLAKAMVKQGVDVVYSTPVSSIRVSQQKICGVELLNGQFEQADAVIIATGGVSYAFTGSTGDGLAMAKIVGHHVTTLRPGLIALTVKQQLVRSLEGLTLKNIRLEFSDSKKKISSEIGEMVFTHNGISGPLVLTLSGQIADWLALEKQVSVHIDLKPGLTNEQLDSRLLREFKGNSKKSIRNVLKTLLPLRLIDAFLKVSAIDAEKRVSYINQKERMTLVNLLKGMRFDISGTLDIEEAMVTRGGVSLKEINPKTMESRIIKGLYFAGDRILLGACYLAARWLSRA